MILHPQNLQSNTPCASKVAVNRSPLMQNSACGHLKTCCIQRIQMVTSLKDLKRLKHSGSIIHFLSPWSSARKLCLVVWNIMRVQMDSWELDYDEEVDYKSFCGRFDTFCPPWKLVATEMHLNGWNSSWLQPLFFEKHTTTNLKEQFNTMGNTLSTVLLRVKAFTHRRLFSLVQ